MGLLNSISRRFGPTVDVRVSPEEIRFHCNGAEAAFAPVLRVNDEGKIYALGAEARSIETGRLQDFFADRHRRGRPWPFEEGLVAFCRYGLILVREDQPSASFVRPNVRVSGAEALRDVLDREEKEILQRVFERAGAASVTFVDVERRGR
jgi:hypothetical protein